MAYLCRNALFRNYCQFNSIQVKILINGGFYCDVEHKFAHQLIDNSQCVFQLYALWTEKINGFYGSFEAKKENTDKRKTMLYIQFQHMNNVQELNFPWLMYKSKFMFNKRILLVLLTSTENHQQINQFWTLLLLRIEQDSCHSEKNNQIQIAS